MGSISTTKPHAVCMPFPGQGHINAMLNIAKLLHARGFHITFVHTEFNYTKIKASSGDTAVEGLPDFRFECVHDGLPPDSPRAVQDGPELCLSLKTRFRNPFGWLVKRLSHPRSTVPPVSCIVSDCLTTFTLDVAAEVGVPGVLVYPVSAAASMCALQLKDLMDRGLVPLKSEDDLTNGYLDTPVDWVPGFENMTVRDFPTFIRTTNPDDVDLNYLADEIQQYPRASAIILNTFDDLERPVLDAMAKFLPPMYTIGPLNLLSRQVLVVESPSIKASLWKQEASCFDWLAAKEADSVIYVNFGSLAIMSSEHLLEFAWGLANSGCNFLWVLRPDLVKGDKAVLPNELLAEIEGRGLLISWCAQEDVLNHPAVGGFLTHCGWNSSMEAISAGVPALCWPYFADQSTNCKFMCGEWGIGMEVDSNVKREEVERLVRELMGGEKGKEMRRKALEWKESAIRATERRGSSFSNFEMLAREVLQKRHAVRATERRGSSFSNFEMLARDVLQKRQ